MTFLLCGGVTSAVTFTFDVAGSSNGLVELSRTFRITDTYLLFPIDNIPGRTGELPRPMALGLNDHDARRLAITVEGKLMHNVGVQLAGSKESADWWAFLYVGDMLGKDAQLKKLLPPGSKALELIYCAPAPPKEDGYDHDWRPQFHFSTYRGRMTDPNGMVYFNGKYHLFYQHNPFGIHFENMYWGHAVSDDMIHWKELPHALRPNAGDRNRSMLHPAMAQGQCHSGSAWVDADNVMGLQNGDTPTLLAYFTDTGVHEKWTPSEAMAYSIDGGDSWQLYEENPVIEHNGRDPKVIWHEESQHWVICAYDEEEGGKKSGHSGAAIYRSKDLKNWERTDLNKGFFECMELFSLPVDGDETKRKWVLHGGQSKYQVGEFDGKVFTADEPGKFQKTIIRAATGQCFNHEPKGRVIYIGCPRIEVPDAPNPRVLNQPFTFTHSIPMELTLHSSPQGIRMHANPVEEVNRLRGKLLLRQKQSTNAIHLKADTQLADIFVTIDLDHPRKGEFLLEFDGGIMHYKPSENKFLDWYFRENKGRMTFRLLIDRPFFEVFVNNGVRYYSVSRTNSGKLKDIEMSIIGGRIVACTVYEMKSIWENARDDLESHFSLKENE